MSFVCFRRGKVKHLTQRGPLDRSFVSELVFRPSSGDNAGISVSCVPPSTETQALAIAQATPDEFVVARFPGRAIADNDMTIKEDPTPDDPGHCLIPEINSRYGTLKRNDVERMRMLEYMAALASASVYAHYPVTAR